MNIMYYLLGYFAILKNNSTYIYDYSSDHIGFYTTFPIIIYYKKSWNYIKNGSLLNMMNEYYF